MTCKHESLARGLRATGGVVVAIASLAVLGCKQPQSAVPPVVSSPARGQERPPAEQPKEQPRLVTIFCGAAGRPAIEEVANAFEKEYGVVVARAYGGSGTVLSQMIIGETGDVYVPGSDDFMEIAEGKGVIIEGTRKTVCYLVPGIAVQKGNPKGISSLQDLTEPGIRVGIGNPEAVCLGAIAANIFEEAGVADAIRPNVVTHAGSCGQVATLLKLKEVDAVIGWDVFAHWAPEEIEFVPIPEELARPRHIPAAVVKFSQNQQLARQFVDFISESEASQEIFSKHGYAVRQQ